LNWRLTKKAWLWLTASSFGMVGCQLGATRPFPDVPLFQAKKPLVGSQPRSATNVLVLAEPDMPPCSPLALAQLPAPPQAIVMERESGKRATMPHPPWLDAVPRAPAVATQNAHEPNQTGVLVSRKKTLAATERLGGVLVRDQTGHFFLLSYGRDAANATWDRVQLLDNGQLGDIESGTRIQATGTWEDAPALPRHSVFHVQWIETLPPGRGP
jgi:hypothetical protein